MSPHCENCGEAVSHSFTRVYRVDGEVHTCPSCVPSSLAGLPKDVIRKNRPDRVAEGRDANKQGHRAAGNKTDTKATQWASGR